MLPTPSGPNQDRNATDEAPVRVGVNAARTATGRRSSRIQAAKTEVTRRQLEGFGELVECLGEPALIRRGHLDQDFLYRRPAALHGAVHQPPALACQGQLQMSPVGGVIPPVQQSGGHQPVAGAAGGVRRMNSHCPGQGCGMHRPAAGDDDQRPELVHSHRFFGGGDGVRRHPDQHPGRGQHGVGHIVQLVGCDLRLDQNLSTIMCTVWSNSRTGAMGNPKPVASQR